MEILRERYEMTHLLGQGGMGLVYRAVDQQLGRVVAIKALNDELSSNPEAVRVFQAEARVMAKLSHPNLLAVYDVLDQGAKSFLVMEYIDGVTLEDIVEQTGPLDIEDGLDVTAQLLVALAYLEQQSVIHRDIKPANMMLTREGALKLMDFGLAREMSRVLQKGTRVRGTPAYMAPEQVTGQELSLRSDLYAMAVSLFELFTGRLPFEDGDMAFHHVFTEAPSAATFRPDLPEPLLSLITRCMRKDPEERPASPHALLLELIEASGERARPWPPSVRAHVGGASALASAKWSQLTPLGAQTNHDAPPTLLRSSSLADSSPTILSPTETPPLGAQRTTSDSVLTASALAVEVLDPGNPNAPHKGTPLSPAGMPLEVHASPPALSDLPAPSKPSTGRWLALAAVLVIALGGAALAYTLQSDATSSAGVDARASTPSTTDDSATAEANPPPSEPDPAAPPSTPDPPAALTGADANALAPTRDAVQDALKDAVKAATLDDAQDAPPASADATPEDTTADPTTAKAAAPAKAKPAATAAKVRPAKTSPAKTAPAAQADPNDGKAASKAATSKAPDTSPVAAVKERDTTTSPTKPPSQPKSLPSKTGASKGAAAHTSPKPQPAASKSNTTPNDPSNAKTSPGASTGSGSTKPEPKTAPKPEPTKPPVVPYGF